MNKHRTHQIDDLAQRVLRDALPTTWVSNEQTNDYGKDYLIEIGDDSGDLTGSSFYVQLKGMQRPSSSSDGLSIKFSLKTKYAVYYLDKIKDLPVFLVAVDVSRKQGWWLFLQSALEKEQNWRNRGSLTLEIPKSQNISDTVGLRQAVVDAKKWLRLHHSESVHESVMAHKERIIRADSRFGVSVSLMNDFPVFELKAREPVSLELSISGDPEKIGQKMSDLIDRGIPTAFQPGEIKITGSKLFETVEQFGCSFESTKNLKGTLTLFCENSSGIELARISDVPGNFTGGQIELWFEGRLSNSPLSIRVGPIAENMGGSVGLKLKLHQWDQQPLALLAHFERLRQFFQALPNSCSTTIECQIDGNVVFCVKTPLQLQPFFNDLTRYLDAVAKARDIAKRFNVDPIWTVESFDETLIKTIEEMYAIFFEGGWTRSMPNVKLAAEFERKTFNFNFINEAQKPTSFRLAKQSEYEFFGERLDVGWITQEYTEMSFRLRDEIQPANDKPKITRKRARKNLPSTSDDTIRIDLIGSHDTVSRVWADGPHLTE